jgi:hypothetical protein
MSETWEAGSGNVVFADMGLEDAEELMNGEISPVLRRPLVGLPGPAGPESRHAHQARRKGEQALGLV